jgi:hypothetical protein
MRIYEGIAGIAHQSTVPPCSSILVRCMLVCSSVTNSDMNEKLVSDELNVSDESDESEQTEPTSRGSANTLPSSPAAAAPAEAAVGPAAASPPSPVRSSLACSPATASSEWAWIVNLRSEVLDWRAAASMSPGVEGGRL